MSDLINFPAEPQRLLHQGEQKLSQQDFLAAKKLFTQLYTLAPTFANSRKVIQSLQMLGEFEQALVLAEEHLPVFLSDQEGFKEYIHLLLLAGQYLAAHRLLQQTTLPTDELKAELQQIEQAQRWFVNEQSLKKQQLDAWERSLRPIPPKSWQEWLKQLTLADFFDLCQQCLQSAQNPFIIPKLVEELVYVGARGKLTIGQQVIELEHLLLPQQMPVFKKVMAFVQQQTQQEPQLTEMLTAEIAAHFALLYPFLPAEDAAEKWGNSYLLEYRSLFDDQTAATALLDYAEIQAQKQKLRAIYQRIL